MTKYLRPLFLAIALMAMTPQAYAKNVAAHHIGQATAPHKAEQEVQKAFDAWIAAVSTGSSEAVMKLYAKDAVLLPTLSPRVDNTPELRQEYFDAFTAKPDLKGTVNEEHIRVFGNTAINSGLYTFSYTHEDETVEVPARFSFVYRKTPHGWMIVDHHSSKLPDVH